MKVYRIADKTYGKGPYVGEYFSYGDMYKDGAGIYDEYAQVGPSCQQHNTPDRDIFGNGSEHNHSPVQHIYNRGYVCGFYNLHNLLHWFPCEVGRMHMSNVGFEVKVYEAGKNFWGLMSQVMFDPTTAVLVEKRNLKTFELC